MTSVRVAMLAPMRPELAPLVKKIPLHRVEGDPAYSHIGTIGDVEVVAAITGIGTRPATEVAERVLSAVDIDHMMIVGIAGGVGPSVEIGDLAVPEVVTVEAGGPEYRATPLGITPHGTIITSDQFGYEPDEIQQFIKRGVIGVDMETASIAAVCAKHNTPWTAFRGISDRGDDDTVDKRVLELGGTDGSVNFPALIRYLLPAPWRIRHLANLARGTKLATNAAADAAIAACSNVKPKAASKA